MSEGHTVAGGGGRGEGGGQIKKWVRSTQWQWLGGGGARGEWEGGKEVGERHAVAMGRGTGGGRGQSGCHQGKERHSWCLRVWGGRV